MFKNYLLIVLSLTSLAMLSAQSSGDKQPTATTETTANNDTNQSDEELNAGNQNKTELKTSSETTTPISDQEGVNENKKDIEAKEQDSKRNTVFDNAPVISKFRPQYIIMGKSAICSVEGESIIITSEEVEKALTAAYDHLKSLVKPEEEFDKRSYVYNRDLIISDLIANKEKSMVQAYGRRLSTATDNNEGDKENSSKKETSSDKSSPDNEETNTTSDSKPADEKSEKTSSGEAKDFIYLNIFYLNNSVRDKPLSRNEYLSEDVNHWRISYDLNSGEVFNLLLN